MLRRAVTASLILVSFAALSVAQSKPNFSGTWKLNTAKSDFGMMPPTDSRVDVIDHNDSTVKIAMTQVGAQGKIEANLTYTLDGKEALNKMGPRDVKSVGSWEGNSIVLNSKLNFNEQEATIKSTWSLSEDGKTLTQNLHLAAAMGETDQKLIFDKQEGGVTVTPSVAKVTAPSAAPTGDKPNFSGTWKLNAGKSDFSVIPPPASRVVIIEHSEPVLTYSNDESGPNGNLKYTLKLTNNGKENDAGNDVKVTSAWEGSSISALIKTKFQDQDLTIKQLSSLSPDGKILTNKNHYISAMGELDTVEVYEKQP